MMPAALMDLTFTDTHVSLGGFTRLLEANDREVLADLVELPPVPTEKQLLCRGRDLHAWLDGPARWLAYAPSQLVIRAPAGSVARDLPWELLADADGHLVARGFSVVRRLAEPGPEMPADDYRLGVLFMAAAPRDAVPLRYEDEEAAILRAVREPAAVTSVADPSRLRATELDLFGEDTGNLDELARRLSLLREHQLDVLHISCHGSSDPPTLSMEDPEGRLDPVPAERLVTALRRHLSALPLAFISACESGKRGAVDSLAEHLIKAGAPAALAWSSKVLDPDATAFAAWLYHLLAHGERLDQAVAEARRELLHAGKKGWHLARLFLGRSRGGPVARLAGRLRPVNATRDPYILANLSGRPRPVCHEAAFVGRRGPLKDALRALRAGVYRGIVLTGIGQQGKSSLAVRLGDRLRDQLDSVMIWGKLDAGRLHAQLADFFGEPLDPHGLVEHEGADRRLRKVLEQWLRQDHRPMLLILDDFEQNLEDAGTAWVPTPAAWPVIVAVLGAFAACPGSRSRLVVTSRVEFMVMDSQGRPLHGCLDVLRLPEMNATERARLRVPREVDAWLRSRIEAVGRGNPGLTEVLLRLAAEDPQECAQACEQLEAAVVPEGDVGATLENIALDTLLTSARRIPHAEELLRVARSFDLPVPARVFDGVMRELGIDRPEMARYRLSSLAILEERGEERHLALNSLVAGRIPPLSRADNEALQPIALKFLCAERIEEDTGLAVQVFLLAASLGDVDALANTADKAVPELPALGDPKRTAPLAVRGCRLLLEQDRVPAPWTLMSAADQGTDVGERVEDLLGAARSKISDAEPHTAASLLLREGQALVRAGRPAEALELLIEAFTMFQKIGDENSRAVVLGDIARVRVDKGEIDEALRLHQERLAVFERLGNARERAVTLGDIARIRLDKAEVDEAFRLHQERLAIFEILREKREHAATLGDIARILVDKGDVDAALRLHQDELMIYEQLGDARRRAVTLGDIARIHADKGELDQALRLNEERRAIFDRLGDARERAITLGDIARILVAKSKSDEALRLFNEELAAFEHLEDARSRAITLGDIARILVAKGQIDEALHLHQERLAVFERLGDAREHAITLGDIARLRAYKGDVDEALRLQMERLAVSRQVGDVHMIAAAQWDLAQLDLNAGYQSAALPRLEEAFKLLRRIGRVDGLAAVGTKLGRVLAQSGQRERAPEVLEIAAAAWRKLGKQAEAQQLDALIASLAAL